MYNTIKSKEATRYIQYGQLVLYFNNNISNMYTNDAMINEIKTFREDSFARELVYLIFPLQHLSTS
jgi:hypothetical protein